MTPKTLLPDGRKDPTYISWSRMKQRIKRGYATLDDPRWVEFRHFYTDMGERPEGRTLHRVLNSRGYSKSNCVWADNEEQQNNRSSNVQLTHEGRTQTLAQWGREIGITKTAMRLRLKKLGPQHPGLFTAKNPGKGNELENR